MLTLANAERIPMSDTTKMTFECENLNNASPATVSRAGIIYVSPDDLGTDPLL
jgi:dynein heavy chain